MERLEALLNKITLFDADTRAFLLHSAASMDTEAVQDLMDALASYTEEREQLRTEYIENKQLLNKELRSELSRMTHAVSALDKDLKHFAQSMEEDPEYLLA